MRLADLRRHEFLSRYLILFGGEAISKLCVLAAFAFLARVLTPGDYGIVELALSITLFFAIGVESGMGSYGARVIAVRPDAIPEIVPRVMALRALLGLPAYIAIVVLAAHYRPAGLGLLAINGLAVLLAPFLTQWVFQGLRLMHWVAAGTILRNLTFVTLILLLMRPGSDIRLVAAAEVAGIAALAVFNAFVVRRQLRIRLNWTGWLAGARRLFGEVWSLGLSDFTWVCLWYSPAVLTGWLSGGRTDEVAWIGAAVRVVVSLHTFVWLYFFNLLPNLARAVTTDLDAWRDLMSRSFRASMWIAMLVAVVGTIGAPVLVPAVFGPAYAAAVPAFQMVVWMIPVAWFSGHFRFSLIAAGQQRWEMVASVAGAVAVAGAAAARANGFDSTDAAAALLLGGLVNAAAAAAASAWRIGALSVGRPVGAPVATGVIGVLAGLWLSPQVGPIAAAAGPAVVLAVMALRHIRASAWT